MYTISALAKLILKINHPKYSLRLPLKVDVKRFKESGNNTICYLLVGITLREG